MESLKIVALLLLNAAAFVVYYKVVQLNSDLKRRLSILQMRIERKLTNLEPKKKKEDEN